MTQIENHRLKIQRDSVCMADDVDAPHEDEISVTDWTVGAIATAIRNRDYLAMISGGLATWILRTDKPDGTPIAVIAQQWRAPKCLVPESNSILEMVCNPDSPAVYVQYHCQVDPDLVLSALRNGQPLPDLYGR